MAVNVDIREYTVLDRESVRRISCDTAFIGAEKGRFFSDGEVLADALTGYFSDYEPRSCFVAVVNNRVVGYITGSKDAKAMEHIFSRRILLPLVIKAFRRGVFFNRKNLLLFWGCFVSMLKGEFYAPDFSKAFPGILHINLDKDFRGQDIGSRLIERFLSYLRTEGVSGVHFGTFSEGGNVFFSKVGFDMLHQSKRSYLRAFIGRDLDFYIFGKKLV